jgi:hypothetical protein
LLVLLYYAHAMCLYGTEAESTEVSAITRCLPYYEIVDPSTLQSHADKSDDGMRYFFKVIDRCDALVFSRLLGEITAGVGLEVNHALTRLIPVYELDDGKTSRITRPVEFLSRDETLKQYALWRMEADFRAQSMEEFESTMKGLPGA